MLHFEVDRTLAREPSVYAETGLERLGFSLDPESTRAAERLFSFRYQATGNEPEQPVAVRVDLVDTGGNAVVGLLAGTMELDFTPPLLDLDQTGVSPDQVQPGAGVVVRVVASEPVTPQAELLVDCGQGAVPFGRTSGGGGLLSFDVPVSGAQPDGTCELAITGLMDHAGNPSAVDPLPCGRFTVDGTAPEIVGLTTDGTRFSLQPGRDLVQVRFALDEETVSLTTTVDDHTVACEQVGDQPFRFLCPYQVSGSEQQGVRPVVVRALDGAGNVGFASTTVSFDFSPPTVAVGDVFIQPELAQPGEQVVVRVVISEEVTADAYLVARCGTDEIQVPPSSWGGGVLSFDLDVPAEMRIGGCALFALQLVDLAGNPTTEPEVSLGQLLVDGVAPVIVSATANRERYSLQPGYDQVTLELEVDELPFALSAHLDGELLGCGGYRPTPPNFTCSYTVSGNESEVPHTIEVRALDRAGNVGVAHVGVVFDFTAPTVPLDQVTVAPDTTLPGKLVFVRAAASEPLLPGAELLLRCPTGETRHGASMAEAGILTFEIPLASSQQDATCELLITGLFDLAHNPAAVAEQPIGAITVDGTAPRITGLATDRPVYSLQHGYDLVEVTFEVDTVPSSIDVHLGDTALPCTLDQEAGNLYTCLHPVLGTEPEEPVAVVVWAQDEVGNVTTAGTGVNFDFTAPSMVESSISHRLTPAAGPASVPVTRVTAGTLVELSFTASELLLVAPEVAAIAGPSTLEFGLEESEGTAYRFRLLHEAALTACGGADLFEVLPLVATLIDLAGNPAEAELPYPELVVDTTPPCPLTGEQLARILYTRTPWGSDGSHGERRFTVSSDGVSVVEPGATLLFLDAPAPDAAAEIGRGQGRTDGSFDEVRLDRADRVRVYLSQIDEAGNLDGAEAMLLSRARWVATFGGKQPGDAFSNPHELLATPRLAPTLYQAAGYLGPDASELERVAERGGGGYAVEAAHSWEQRALAKPGPSARSGHALVHDSSRGMLVLFGGSSGSGETWEWDLSGREWVRIQPTGATPPPRWDHAMAYDAGRGKTVLFGGANNHGVLDDTWEWNGRTGSWAEVSPAGEENEDYPTARSLHAMAYDRSRRQVILHAGRNPSLQKSDTWSWDGTRWQKLAEGVLLPGPRDSHAMAYDPRLGRVVLTGGRVMGAPQIDVWEWSGSAWIEAVTHTSTPPERYGHALYHDAARQRLVLFGGVLGGGSSDNTVWEWYRDPSSPPGMPRGDWFVRGGQPRPPAVRSASAMIYDPVRETGILFGGKGLAGDLADFWEHEGARERWRELSPGGDQPPPRHQPAAAYHTSTEQVILFGGEGDGGLLDDLWSYDGALGRWQRIEAEGPGPSPRRGAAMAYHELRDQILLFGGYDGTALDDTWELIWDTDRTLWVWHPAVLCTEPPAARYGHGMAYAPGPNAVVMGDGADGDVAYLVPWTLSWSKNMQCWSWVWSMVDETAGVVGWEHVSFGYDRRMERTLTYPSLNRDGDPTNYILYFDWDSETGWSYYDVFFPGCDICPTARLGGEFAYDRARGEMLLFGGLAYESDTWKWNGDRWADASAMAGDNPTGRYGHALVYDPARQRAVLFGGDTGSLQQDTWEWSSALEERAAVLAVVVWHAAGAGAVTPESLRITVSAGADGYTTAPEPQRLPGARLLVWSPRDGGAWIELGEANEAAPESPAEIGALVDDPSVVQGLLFGDSRRSLHLAVVPVATNGSADRLGRVALDYFELVADYTLDE